MLLNLGRWPEAILEGLTGLAVANTNVVALLILRERLECV